MTAIVDYGVGNLFSLSSSLKYLGFEVEITSNGDKIERADRIILPGVGAFEDAKNKLEKTGLIPVLTEQAKGGKPFLGICLGMQLLFDVSYEYGEHKGLSLIGGEVVRLADKVQGGVKVPHMGWNSLEIRKSDPLFKYVKNGDYVYYVHSYYAAHCENDTLATSSYGGISVTGAVGRGKIYGTQFHPEKSGKVGLNILKAFCELQGETK